MGCVFWWGAILAVILMHFFFSSCSPRIVETIRTEYRDTTIYKDVTRDTTIYVPIPLEGNQVIVAVGDTSKLETSLARSTAFVGGDGLLHHDLRNKSEKTLPVVVPIHSITINTQVTDKTAQVLTKIEYRDKPLTWWQKAKIGSFWYLCGALLLLLCYVFRKPLLALVKLILKV